MKHLTRDEFVDFIEGSPGLSADRVSHHDSCAGCRAEADALRAVLARAAADEGPEPSPLFWDHFSARVADAIGAETPGLSPAARLPWFRTPLATWTVAATLSVLVMMTAVWRTTLHAPAPGKTEIATAAAPVNGTTPVAEPDDVDADEAWAVVRAATADMAWDDARAAGISARPGAVENLALELNADERSELARLLDQEMKRNGV